MISLQGFPYDEKSSYLKGAALAPPLIRLAYNSPSANYFAENGREIRPELLEDHGDFEIEDYFEITKVTSQNLKKGQPLISLGGDHSITYPILKAFHELYGKIAVLQFDAHPDLYDRFEGDPYSHACPFARIMEEGLISGLTQVGVRTMNTHQKEQAERFGVSLLEMKDFHIDKIRLPEGPLYLSVDLDALDPAYAPGVSHPEPGGLSTRELLKVFQKVKGRILGADIVEYNSDRDINGVTAMVAAKILKEIASATLESHSQITN